MRLLPVMLLLFLFSISGGSQIIFKNPLSERVVHYKINVTLNPSKKQLTGVEYLQWKNTTSRTTDSLFFHLYLNAFKSRKTTFIKESHGAHRGFKFNEKRKGFVEIDSISVNGVDYTNRIQFIRPDDGNKHDSTVMVIVLPRKINPGEKVDVFIQFRDQLPRVFARTGYYEDFFMVGQWFPKIGVLEEDGWNCHQFHANSEFYADFGVYDVKISVPPSFIVGATGLPLDTLKGDSLITYQYRAEDVHDFAWTASPRFKKETRTIRGVEIELLYQPEHKGTVDRHFKAIDHALHYYGDWYVPYPYPKLTMVDPPMKAFGAGGMEYPTLITCGTVWGMSDNIRFIPEGVVIHEFGHQYFYGIMASNEFEEAWLDEGMNTYTTSKIMAKVYGEWTSSANFFWLQSGDLPSAHFSYIKNQRKGVIYQKSWTYPPGGYSFNSYQKPTLVLYTLENFLGKDIMAKIWKEYFKRYAFTHPKTEDFIKTVLDVTGKDLNWYFNQFIYGDAVVDYKVLKVSTYFDHKDSSKTRFYRNEIWISREKDGKIPVDIKIVFDNGKVMMEKWDGQNVAKKFEYTLPAKVAEVQIDPERKIYLDVNWTNNSWRRENKNSWVYYLRNRYLFLLGNLFMGLTN